MGLFPNGNGTLIEWAQTITIGITGQLTRVDVEVLKRGSTSEEVLVSILGTKDQIPDSGRTLALASIASEQIPSEFEPAFTSLDISNSQLSVNAGDVLAIGFFTTEDVGGFGRDDLYFLAFGTGFTSGTQYLGGLQFDRINGQDPWRPEGTGEPIDFFFRVFVDPTTPIPEPGTIVLIAVGFAGIHLVRRFKVARHQGSAVRRFFQMARRPKSPKDTCFT